MGVAGALAFGPSEASIGGASALWAPPSARAIASAALGATLPTVSTVSTSAISEPSASSAALAAVGRATSTSLTTATAATRPGGFAPVAGVSEREVGVVTLRAGPVVVVERASLGSAVVPTASVVTTSLPIIEASISTTIVSESSVVPSTTVVALAATAGSGLFAAVADRAAGKVGIVAFRAGPIVEGWLASAALTVVVASVSASVVSRPTVVAPALTAILSLFGRLFLGSNGHRDADQGVHVE